MIDPFTGSGAFLLTAPESAAVRTINDADGYVINFWRAVASAPDEVAKWADWPAIEADLYARHVWLNEQRAALLPALYGDPTYYNAQIAGWWVWGAALYIGDGWVSETEAPTRSMPHLGNAGRGVMRPNQNVTAYMRLLAAKLRGARILCGDWKRVLSPAVIEAYAANAVILDPPYSAGDMNYSAGGNDTSTIAAEVWAWALENGANPKLRIAVCGYEDGRETPPGWHKLDWTGPQGYGKQGNRHLETVWFSPYCTPVPRGGLFDGLDYEE